VEPQHGDATGLLVALGSRSCVTVTDDFPIKSVTAKTEQVARRMKVRLERVDSNGLLPLQAPGRVFPTAYAFRRFLQRALPDHLPDARKPNPLVRAEPRSGAGMIWRPRSRRSGVRA